MKLQRTDPEVMFAERMGGRIYKQRMKMGMTREQLRQASGVSRALIFRVENGLATPSAFTVFTLAAALGICIKDLYPACQVVSPEISEGQYVPAYITYSPMREAHA